MRIIRLTSENVKRIIAVDVIPTGTLVSIGGKNGAGKSSVLDSIAYALGGERLAPPEPIRKGQARAKIVVDLGDFIVTRQFLRSKKPCTCDPIINSEKSVDHSLDCESHQWDETRSTLSVTNKEGAKYPSPQAMLDKLLGKLTFDPLAFSQEEPKKQNEILRRLTNLDFTPLNNARKESSDNRSIAKKSLVIVEANIDKLPFYPDMPVELISIEEVSAEMKKGQSLQREAEIRIKAVDIVADQINELTRQRNVRLSNIEAIRVRIEELQKQASVEANGVAKLDGELSAKNTEAQKLAEVAEEAKAKVPNFEQLDARLREIDNINGKIRANKVHDDQKQLIERYKKTIEEEDDLVKAADAQKLTMLQSVKFPVEGLGLTDDGVTWNGLPLEQASASEQLRISVAIGLALNPTLNVLLIRNGNLLDDDSLKLLAEQAEEAKAQVWMEFVTKDPEGMTVLLEDGHAKA